ncbi:GNAT family N-acetyltransferase [Siculibacillus lacustris]|uniref:GNAT family N-acetyltransferase n=1 Tax=Siculibacillus lacustris TaxID=1549641 RepID=A0A4Q9VS30_9HYPH|nr:GNAT family N-acetyltransferase [Siculibacillus lacustris]TBW38433.1 GNAT family N-acetyltransferase [Siculibacillus lacustris]
MPPLAIAPATPAEVDLLVEWAALEGWNPGLGDAGPFRASDPDGFHLARLDGEPVAGISVVTYDEAFAFLGFYICAPAHRGRGFGWATWQAGLAHAGARTVGLDGVVAQLDNYRRSGFALAHRNIRYAGRVDLPPVTPPGVTAVTAAHLPALITWDAPRFGAERAGFVTAWCDGGGGRIARIFVEDGRIRGWGVVRPARVGHKIGPLYAETPVVAEALFVALAGAVGDTTLVIDPPEPNAAARALAERHGLAPVFETARMYRGPAPALPLAEIWGISSFELG